MTCPTVLVTGASGLLGSNVCRLAANEGRRVRGLVRTDADAKVLRAIGVEPAIGDTTDPGSLDDAMAGVDGLIHAAAVLGGTWSSATADDFDRVNYHGSLAVLDAARQHSVERIVVVSSMVIYRHSVTVTESSPLVSATPALSPYARAKLAIYYEGMHRVCRGEHISFVVPGAMYGPSPFSDRLCSRPVHRHAMRRDPRRAHGVCELPAELALRRGCRADRARHAGQGTGRQEVPRCGRADDVLSLAGFCNLGCAVAGVAHRVAMSRWPT